MSGGKLSEKASAYVAAVEKFAAQLEQAFEAEIARIVREEMEKRDAEALARMRADLIAWSNANLGSVLTESDSVEILGNMRAEMQTLTEEQLSEPRNGRGQTEAKSQRRRKPRA